MRSAGFSVMAINEPLETQLDSSFDLASFLRSRTARVFSIDIHWHEHLFGALRAANVIKSIHPACRVVAGGITATAFANDLLQLSRDIDVVISGYGEGALPRLFEQNLPNKRRVLRLDYVPELDRYDHVSREFLRHHNEYLQCSVSRWLPDRKETVFWLKNGQGCNFNCASCGGSHSAQRQIFGNGRLLRRSPGRIAQDLVRLAKEGVHRVGLTQDLSLAPKAHWQAVHKALRESETPVGVYFECNALPGADYLQEFARTFDLSRSTLVITPHCHDESIRAFNGKRFSNAALFNCLQLMKELRIQFAIYLTADLPGSQRITPAHAASFKREIESYSPLFIFETCITLDPKSPMSEKPARFGVVPRISTCRDYLSRSAFRAADLPFDAAGYSLVPSPPGRYISSIKDERSSLCHASS
jgi:hypothetical protein